MNIDNTDEEILESLRNGNEDALKILIDKYTPVLFSFVSKFTNKENTQDIVQETFIKIWKNIYKYDEKKSGLKTWIFTITKNTVVDFLRKKKSVVFSSLEKDEESSFSENIRDENPLPMELLQKMEDIKFLEDLLKTLPEHYRAILLLHYQEEMTFEEIGKVLDKPLNTVKSYHHRALIKLRETSSPLHQK